MPPKSSSGTIKKEDFENLKALVDSQGQALIEQGNQILELQQQIIEFSERYEKLEEETTPSKQRSTTRSDVSSVNVKLEVNSSNWGKCAELSNIVSGMAQRQKGGCKYPRCNSVISSYCKKCFNPLSMTWASLLKCIYCANHQSAHEEENHVVE